MGESTAILTMSCQARVGHPGSREVAKIEVECAGSMCMEARSQNIWLGNRVRDPKGWAKHRVKSLAGSDMQEIKPESDQGVKGSGQSQGQWASQIRYPERYKTRMQQLRYKVKPCCPGTSSPRLGVYTGRSEVSANPAWPLKW